MFPALLDLLPIQWEHLRPGDLTLSAVAFRMQRLICWANLKQCGATDSLSKNGKQSRKHELKAQLTEAGSSGLTDWQTDRRTDDWLTDELSVCLSVCLSDLCHSPSSTVAFGSCCQRYSALRGVTSSEKWQRSSRRKGEKSRETEQRVKARCQVSSHTLTETNDFG